MTSSIEQELREAAKASGLTRAELARRAAIPYSAIHGFMAGTRSLTLTTASRLCDVLGLGLRPKVDRAARRKARQR